MRCSECYYYAGSRTSDCGMCIVFHSPINSFSVEAADCGYFLRVGSAPWLRPASQPAPQPAPQPEPEKKPAPFAPPVARSVLSLRETCQSGLPLDGDGAKCLEQALAITERERDAARRECDRLRVELAEARRVCKEREKEIDELRGTLTTFCTNAYVVLRKR